MAPVLNRLTMDSIGSTSSSGTGGRTPFRNRNRPRSVMSSSDWSSTALEYSRKMSYRRSRVACCSRKTVSGLKRCGGPSRRHWYSPPVCSRSCESTAPSCGYAWACRSAFSFAMTSMPTPPRIDDVPVKYRSTNSWLRPTASNAWAPA